MTELNSESIRDYNICTETHITFSKYGHPIFFHGNAEFISRKQQMAEEKAARLEERLRKQEERATKQKEQYVQSTTHIYQK